MSRVKKPKNKFVNPNKYDSSITGQSKKVRIHFEGQDFRKADTLTQWLFMKYNMSYRTYRNKSKKRRKELREEFKADTGIDLMEKQRDLNYQDDWDSEYENAMELLWDIGVPFSPDGTPLGIGWDD